MTLMLLDSASLWYRAYYGMPDTLLAPDGTPVNAIRGYLDMTARLVGIYKPNRIVACLDGDWRPSWRVDIFPEYKANRLEEDGEEEVEPETLTPQIPILLDILDLFGIEPGPIRIVTGDRDLFQMVDDKRDIKVVYLAKGISQHDLVDVKYVSDKYAIPGDRYDLFAMFRGDPSDGLPGVKGIGEKGAAVIANSFATVEDALAAAHEAHPSLPPALAKKIIAGSDYLSIAPKLVRVARDAPLPKVDLAMPKAPADLSKLYQMKDQYGLGASIDRLIAALGW
jgi:5'-3' exonuclease